MKRKLSKKWVIGLIVVGILLVGFAGFRRLSRPVVNIRDFYTEAAAARDTIEIYVPASGTVNPTDPHELTAQTPGTVEKLSFEEGAQVMKDDIIAELQGDALEQEIDRLQGNLKQQKITLSKLEESLKNLEVRAPISGRVKSLEARPGEEAGSIGKAYGALAVISTEGKMNTAVKPEAGITLEEGQEVNVVLEDGTAVEGTVIQTGASLGIEIQRDDLPVGVSVKVFTTSGMQAGEGELELAHGVGVSGGSGYIDKVYVRENSMVKRGDLLFTLEDTEIRANIDSQKISMDQTEEDLRNKTAELQDLKIAAPINGVIVSQPVKEGDMVQKGQTIASVIDPGRMEVNATVDELDVAKVEIGQKVRVKVDALPEKIFDGEVTQAAYVGKSVNGVTSYDITASIVNPEGLRTGMSASLEILVARKEDVVLLPIEAVQERDGQKYVILASMLSDVPKGRRGRAAVSPDMNTAPAAAIQKYIRPVETGLMNETQVEITKGLEDGVEVLIPVAERSDSQRTFSPFGGGRNRTSDGQN